MGSSAPEEVWWVKKADGDLEIEDCWDCSHMSTTSGSGSVEPVCSYGLGWGWGVSGRIVVAEELPFPDWCPLAETRNAPEEVKGE